MSRARLSAVPDLDRELDELYGRPLAEFTTARNDLAKRLRNAGQQADAERVGALAKPSISAWAVNQVARRDAATLGELLEAGESLVAAQKAALAGKGADRFEEASRRHREAIRGLAVKAAALLDEAGHRPSDTIRQRIASSIRAASLDVEGRRLLEHGRLEADFESAGLELLAGLGPGRPKRTKPSDDERKARLREARAHLEAARAEERRLGEEAAEAQREAERATAAAEAATKRARGLEDQAARAASAVAEAEKAVARLEDE